jgi:hypothetical protein
MIRATLLYDSIVLRLDNQLDRYDEYTEFMKDRAELVKLKWKKKLRQNAGDDFVLNVEELGKALNDLMIRTQTTLGKPIVSLGSTVNKWIFAVSVLTRMAGRVLLVTLLALGAVNLNFYLTGAPVSFSNGLSVVLNNSIYRLLLIGATVFSVRRIIYRLRDRDQ